MPRTTSDIAHTAAANHRIPRWLTDEDPFDLHQSAPTNRSTPLVLFHRDLLNEEGVQASRRDIGVALMMEAKLAPDNAARVSLARQALPLLERAVDTDPADVRARHAQAISLSILGETERASRVFESAIEIAPQHEEILEDAANLAHTMGKRELAVRYLDRAVAIDPWRSAYYQNRAQVEMEGADWKRAIDDCRDALRLNPSLAGVRMTLIESLLQTKDRDQAAAELELLLKLGSPYPAAQLRRWFENPR